MKQIIVMIAMVILGISIAGFVGEFKGSAEEISHNARDKILLMVEDGSSGD